ncbi:MAG: AlpA family phage regulatory protein [Acidimicrobiaceae bacterium]|nr:AlpA family phage regulatory protein [Acidimicrobiaceae bacterium]
MTQDDGVRLLGRPEVEHRCGIGRSEIYRRLDSGDFPEPVRIGRAVRWRSDDIAAWIDALPRATR